MGLANRMVETESRPGALGVAGILVGFGGVGLLVEPHGELAANARAFVGAMGVLAAAVLWALGSLYARRADLPKDNALSTGMQMIGGAAGLVVAGTLTGEWSRVDVGGVTTRSLVALLYLIVFGSLVAFSAYVWLLQVAAPAKVATYAYVNPVVAVLLGWALGGEAVSARTLVASAVIVGAVVMITAEKARAAAARGRSTSGRPREEPA
jgi:drug/metabolite transporter (DMT)-like permease